MQIVCFFNKYINPAISQHRTYGYCIQIELVVFCGFISLHSYRVRDGSVPLYSDTDELARGTATIALSIGQRLCVDIGRVEIIATAQNLNEHFPDELLYTGSGQTDMLLDQQVRLEVVMQPIREVVKLLPLAFIGAGDFASERFLLKARVPYAVHIEYREAITVDLIDSINGDRVEHLLQVTGDERERVSLSRTFNLHNTKEVFLHIRDTSKAWYIEIHEGE